MAEIPKSIKAGFKGKRILITGVAGTIGSALAQSISTAKPEEIIGIDNSEAGLFRLERQLGPGFRAILGDIRDSKRMNKAICRRIDILFHAAALKHVPMCEHNPLEAVRTNLLGLQNVVDASISANIPRVIFTSTDKAVNPTNVMGASKLMGEQLIRAANIETSEQVFSTTRFGNVLGSSGSVVPIFAQQIIRGGPVTLTSAEMSRFVMTLDDAVSLVLRASQIAKGGEIFVTKMRSISILTLAKAMIATIAPRYGIESDEISIDEIGTRPGEKSYEELMSDEEVRRTIELRDYFVIFPALTDLYTPQPTPYPDLMDHVVSQAYTSKTQSMLSEGELSRYLEESGAIAKWSGS
jgi:FlaA1/EpsC-like NDP-sugar epimerase